MKNMDDPFQVKKLKINTQIKSDPIEKEQSKSAAPVGESKPEKKAGKMMRIFSKKETVKYDRKEVKQPMSATTTKAKTSTVKKSGGWK